MSWARALLPLLLAIVIAGCDDGGPTDPSISTGGSTTVNVSGVWSGSAADSVNSFRMALTLTQTRSIVSGTMTGTTAVGAPLFSNATVTGEVAGRSFSFSIVVPPGGVRDNASCTAVFAAITSDLLSTSMAGNYTGSDTCGGTFVGGRFQLIKE